MQLAKWGAPDARSVRRRDGGRIKQSTALVLISVATVILGLAALGGAMPAMYAPMMFDAPGSENNPATKLLFLSVVTFPLTCIAALVACWVLYSAKRYTAACLITLLPVTNLILFGIAWLWLSVVYDGSLAA